MWSSIIGHERQIDRLRKALASGRLPSAWLFAGPRGVGKRRTADVLAAAIACGEAAGRGGDPCGSCAACRKVAAQNHPDVFVVEPESEQETGVTGHDNKRKSTKKLSETLKVEQIRDLQARLQFHPLEARAKLAIIDESDRMSESTANSLLKILEEPPAATHFVLISTRPDALLPTIRSRTSRLDFGPLSDEQIAGALSRGGGMTREEAQRISRLSGGSLGQALALDPDFIGQTLGRFLALGPRGNSSDIFETAEEWSHRPPPEQRLLFDLLASFYRDLLRLQATGDTSALIHPEAMGALPRTSHARAERALSEIEAARRSLETSANKQLMFETLLFSLAG